MNKYKIELNDKIYKYTAENCDGAMDKLSNRKVFGNNLTCNISLKMYDADTRGDVWAQYDVDGKQLFIEMEYEIIESDYDLKNGFAWTRFEIGGHEFYLQACLMEREECSDEERRYQLVSGNKTIYKKAINENDDGMNWGVSGEANFHAFQNLDQETRDRIFRKAMREIRIRIV